MADIHAVDNETGEDGKPIPPAGGIFETRDLVYACVLGTLDFEMRGYQPCAIVVNGTNAATLLKKGGHGNLELCRTSYYFLYQGPTDSPYGDLNHSRVYAAYFLARQYQRQRRGDNSNDFPKVLDRAFRAAQKHDVTQELVHFILGMVDTIANLFVLADTIRELKDDPMVAFVRALGRPGGFAHIASPLHHETKLMDRNKFLGGK